MAKIKARLNYLIKTTKIDLAFPTPTIVRKFATSKSIKK